MKLVLIFSLSVFICCSQVSFGQKGDKKIIVTGTVLDENQKPVEGATIFIDKIKTSSVTDTKGYYKVKTSPEAREILVFSLFNGAKSDVINGRTSINFTLKVKSKEPSDKNKTDQNETVNIGYGTVQKNDISTQIGVIDGQDPKYASYSNIYDMIHGQVPGVEVNGKSIKIMGSSSLNVSTEPLFVVDGIIVYSIDDVVPQDVKSIEILKGASASVYGTRGSNGVILITRHSWKDKK
jgi:TonB-dependent SusC/RagA subfamily outer membrane receptor